MKSARAGISRISRFTAWPFTPTMPVLGGVTRFSRPFARLATAPRKRAQPELAQTHALTTPSPASWLWHDGHGKVRSFADVLAAIQSMMDDVPGCEVHVGTDSKLLSRSNVRTDGGLASYKYVTAVCLRENGRGASYWHSRHSCRLPYVSLDMRLLKEVENSIAVADLVCAHLRSMHNSITVHADSNTDERFKSAKYTPMLISIIQSMQYDFRVKPASWATWVADRHCKSRN